LATQVLHVIARMNIGGTARYVGEIVEKIPNSKLATGYVQGSEIEDLCVERIAIERVPHLGRKVSIIDDFRAWKELEKLVKELEPAIVHTHTFKAGLIGRLVRGNHKRVHTFHGHLFNDRSFSRIEKWLIVIFEKFLAKRTDVLISVGEKVGIEIRARGIGNDQRWISIAPGVNPLPLVVRDEARKALGLPVNGVFIGWMARMAHVKNPYLFLEIAKNLPELNFVMAGGGDLLELIKQAAPKNVKVVGWADAKLFWSAVDCAISTSDNEGMPVALIEAQLSALPVVAANVGSVAEVIENGVTGTITSNSLVEMVEAVRSLCTDVATMHSMGKAAKIQATRKFGIETMLQKHLGVYSSLNTA